MNQLIWKLPYDVRRSVYRLLRRQTYAKFQQLRLKDSDVDSLKPFIERKAIFVHIPKTAGISVCHALFGSLSGGHKRIREYSIAFSKEEFHSFFKFAFVRHPADRLCSAFSYLRKGGRTSQDAAYGKKVLARFEDMNEFVETWFDVSKLYDYLHFVPQYEFMCLAGVDPQVDFLGKFESLSEDFDIIARKLGVHVELPEMNSSKQNKDWKNQLSIENREKIAELYSIDYELFGYDV